MKKSLIFRQLAGKLLAVVLLATFALSVGAASFENIKKSGVVTVCADPSSLPLSDSRLDPPGYEIEFAEEIAKNIGAKLQYNWFATERMGKVFRELYDGKCDFIVGIPTDKRLDGAGGRLALSQPYLVSGFALVIGEGRREKSLEELKGQRIGVGLHTVADFVAFELGYDRVLFAKQGDVFDALAKGEIAAGLIWAPMAGWLTKNNPAVQVKILAETHPKLTFPLAVGVSNDDPEFLDAVNGSIRGFIESGGRDIILEKYGIPHLNSRAVSTSDVIARSIKSVPDSEVGDPQRSLRQAVWQNREPSRSQMREVRSPFIKTVGGSSKSSGWPPTEEQGAQNGQKAIEREKGSASAEQHLQGEESGYNLYHRACGKCHGRNAISGGIFPDLRRFEGSDQDFVATVKSGRPGTVMPAWEKFLKDGEIERIRKYVKSASAE